MITLIRDDPAVAAIVSGRVSTLVEAPPAVRLTLDTLTRRPFGPGSGRVNEVLAVYFARCHAADTPTGAIAAMQLAGAVSDALEYDGPRKVGTTWITRTYASELDSGRDPDTRWPFVDVRIDLYASAEAAT